MAEEYTNTLNLPKTDFSMRANLPAKEPEIQKTWEDMDIYSTLLEERKNSPKFILHDGPPFANGDIHMGHTLNKTLKDIVLKYKAMSGYCTPYVPGWDTHGLPIEQQAIKKLKIDKNEVSPAEFRKVCKEFAEKYVDNQREQFKRLGIIADWDNPYLTLDPEFEANQIRVFGEMVKKNFIYKGLKPVYWCTDCETALAEAEIDYAEDKADSIYVKFKVIDDKGLFGVSPAYFVIWTTTTWTLPGNVAISLNPKLEYGLYKANNEYLVMATELSESTFKAADIQGYELIKRFMGSELEYIKCAHPFLERESVVIVGDHVTLDAGTGCVHTAPGHGMEDYIVCRNYPEIPIIVPVDGKGVLNDEAGAFAGMYYKKSNKAIVEDLTNKGLLFAIEPIVHQYPHCWRCQHPIVFRATEQWFASVDGFKQQALDAIKGVKWIPEWGEERIANMVRDRADWCISRQRLWGVPIPIFYCSDCGEPILRQDIINHVADIFQEKGSNAWFELDASELLPTAFQCGCGGSQFTKEKDTMDVWFDSGTSHVGVLEAREGLSSPCDMYLEGNDQYRGWFQSSLLTSVAHSGKAPYKAVLTHGFVVDGEGRKMSKSLGNGLPPLKIIDEYGADILRLWVASTDYKSDIRISKDILKQLSESYRKIRNTARYILGNISDFDPNQDMIEKENMLELDRWALMRLNMLTEKVLKAYESYEYHIIYHNIHKFCVVDMSNFYLDIIKDRLYTEKSDSLPRRSSQTAMYTILDYLVRLLAPILAFTSEEIWSYMPSREKKSILFAQMPVVDSGYYTEQMEQKWEKILSLRDDVAKELEGARSAKLIGNSLEAKVSITADGAEYEFISSIMQDLAQLLIVSELDLKKGTADEMLSFGKIKIEVTKTGGEKCPRCWMYSSTVGTSEKYPDLCERCTNVMQ